MDTLLSIYSAISTNDVERTKKNLKDLPLDINTFLAQYKMSPLSLAMKQNCSKRIIEALIVAKINVNEGINHELLDDGDVNPLILACKNKNYDVLDVLIRSGAIVDVKDHLGIPLLHLACKNGFSFVKLLIDNGADPHVICPCKNNVLHVSVNARASYEMFHYLLKYGVSPGAKNNAGKTTIDLALVEEGIDVGIKHVLEMTQNDSKKKLQMLPAGSKRKSGANQFPLEKLRADIQKEEKKLKTADHNVSVAYKKMALNQEKRLHQLKVCAEARKKLTKYMDTGNKLFSTYLDCPICLVDFTHESKIYQCSNGHVICGECIQKVQKCPQCQIQLAKLPGIRNRVLENIIADMRSN